MPQILQFRILGPTELWSAGQQYDLGSTKERTLLAILALTPRTIVPADSMIDRLWGTLPPTKARETLSAYVTRLRTVLREAADDSVRLAGRANGYVLDVDPDAVDLHQFRRLRRQADAVRLNGDYDHAARLLREADTLWRGQALAGTRGDWVARMRDSLEEERRAAILERVECDLERGRHANLVSELRGLLAQYPLDETFAAHQMTALYWSGRAGDALRLYRETRSRLVDEQGTEPGPALAELHRRILRRDPQLAVRLARTRPGDASQLGTLPPDLPQFVGRSAELADLTGYDDDGPHVAVIEGMAGIGKTTLAVRAARMMAGKYPDGLFYLNLQAHDPSRAPLDSAEALNRLLSMLDVPPALIPGSVGERAATWRSALSGRRSLVILDDVAGRDQIRPLLPAAGQCLILITARRRLADLVGARVLSLDVLSLDDAVTLLGRIVGPGQAGEQDDVATVVRLCGCLPLAIQLMAGKLAHGHYPGVTELVAEWSNSRALLGRAGPLNPELTSAFDLSYGDLEADHQRFFRRLGLLPGTDISLPGAAALAGIAMADAEKAVNALLDHHLMTRAPADRFRFHELVHAYAAGRAARDEAGRERRQAVGRLLDFYLHATDRAGRVLHPFRPSAQIPITSTPAAGPALGTPDDAARWLELEWRNILQLAEHAARHEWKRQCADLTHLMADFLETSGHWQEAVAAHTLALQASRDIAAPARIARASLQLAAANQQTGRLEAAAALAKHAAAIYQSLGEQPGLADAIDQIGLVNQRAGQPREALAHFGEARTLYDSVADKHGMATASSHSGIACWHLGRYPDAVTHMRQALLGYRDVGDSRGVAKTLNNLGKMQLLCGYHRDALGSFEESLEIFTRIGGAQNQAILHHNIGGVYHYRGSHEKGLASYQRALSIYRNIGDLPDEADVLNDIGAVYRSADCSDEALIHYQRANSIAQQIGNLPLQVTAFRGVADVRRGSGQYNDALDDYGTALRLARQIGDPYEEAKILQGIAETTLSTSQPYAARIIFRQALDIFERLGVPEAETARIRLEATDPVV